MIAVAVAAGAVPVTRANKRLRLRPTALKRRSTRFVSAAAGAMLAAAQRQLNRLRVGSLLIDGRISPQRRRLSVSRHVCGAGKQHQQQQPSGEGGKPLARSIRAMPIRIISVSKGTPASNAYGAPPG